MYLLTSFELIAPEFNVTVSAPQEQASIFQACETLQECVNYCSGLIKRQLAYSGPVDESKHLLTDLNGAQYCMVVKREF